MSGTSASRSDSDTGNETDARKLELGTRVLIAVAAIFIRTLARTWRITSIGREYFDNDSVPRSPVIFSFWHGQMLPLIAEHKRHSHVLISDHRDGEIIAQIIQRFGLRVIRGSTSRGGARALLQLSRTLDSGDDIGITPDGPRGPRHSVATGALIIAQRTGAAIIPLATRVSRAWTLDSWDKFEIPKPFARIVVAYDKPMMLTATNAREAATETDRLAEAMRVIGERASEALVSKMRK